MNLIKWEHTLLLGMEKFISKLRMRDFAVSNHARGEDWPVLTFDTRQRWGLVSSHLWRENIKVLKNRENVNVWKSINQSNKK